MEQDVFITKVPLDTGFFKTLKVSDNASGEISGEINGEIKKVYLLILSNEGIKAKDIATGTNRPKKTIDKYLKKLKELGKITYRGSNKTGGYYINIK